MGETYKVKREPEIDNLASYESALTSVAIRASLIKSRYPLVGGKGGSFQEKCIVEIPVCSPLKLETEPPPKN